METFVRENGYSNLSLQSYSNTGYMFARFSEPLNYNGTTASQEEVDRYNKMKASVEEYNGFYVGRYEISNDGKDNVQSKKNKIPWVDIKFSNSSTDLTGGMLEKAKQMYPEISSHKGEVVSTLIYGVAWDETVRFIKKNYPEIEKDSRNYGYYGKLSSSINTGSVEEYSLNNIYDMAGNVSEMTMECYGSYHSVTRGGDYNNDGINSPISVRCNITTSFGGRLQLYIK